MTLPAAGPRQPDSEPDPSAARGEWSERAIGPAEPFEERAYVRVLDRPSLGPVEVLYDRVRIRRYREADVDLLSEWLASEAVYAPLGFPRPVERAFVARSAVPDLSGGAEPVDFLIVEDVQSGRPIGFIVAYEARRPDDPHQEVDFALPVRGFGTTRRVRAIRTGMLTYLFCLCGARSVSWVRMRRVGTDARDADPGLTHERGTRHRVDRADYRAVLERIARTRSRRRWPSVRRPLEAGSAQTSGGTGTSS